MTSSNCLHLYFVIICTTSGIIVAQISELTYVVAEERPALMFVGNVLDDSDLRSLVSPRDILDLRFSFLTERNPHVSLMWINSSSGELRTASRINRETICQKLPSCDFRLQTVVQAQLGSFFKIIQLRITITDINDNEPIFIPSIYTIQIPESSPPGALFRLPTAVDLDSCPENSVVEYNQVATTAPFVLHVNGNGSSLDVEVRLVTNLDRENISFYQIFIRAVDGGWFRLTGTLTVNLEVVDVNDNSPVFLQHEYNVNISDSLVVGSVVVVVKATDQDAGDNGLVTYHFVSVQDDLIVFEMFEVNGSTGEVRSKVALDSYAGRSYRLMIEAQDSGSSYKSSRTEVVISVLDTHNSPPEILLNVFGGVGGVAHVSELAELGRVVAHLFVSDPDSNHSANGHVQCGVNKDDQFQLQAMDVRQFKVILIKRLDREQQTSHSVKVICEDSGTPPLNASSSFTVAVDDENDNAPEFTSPYYTTEIIEGKNNVSGDKNVIVLIVNASDKDTGSNAQLTYHLADGSDSDFGLYADGSIVITNPAGLDREDKVKGGVRHLIVLAVDSGKPQLTASTTVAVTILDINDNPPRFSEPVYLFQVSENASLNSIINNISAIDSDLESNGDFYFKMHPKYLNKVPFEVSSTGAVKLSGKIDREITPSFLFYIIANDMGNPQQSSTVEVRIQIDDVNDNLPEIIFPNDDNYTIYIPHTQGIHTKFAKIIATDLDEGENGELFYTKNGGNSSNYFDVRRESGEIVLLRQLTSKEIGLHILFVSVHDSGMDVQLTSTSIIHIVVYEENVTVSYKDYDTGTRNVMISVVLIVITITLAFTIFVTIILIHRVDKQSRFYNTTAEELKIESKLKQLKIYPARVPKSLLTEPGVKDAIKGGDKKRKEVSFVLQDSVTNSTSPLWCTDQSAPEKCDFVLGRLGKEIKAKDSGPHDDENGNQSDGKVKVVCDSGNEVSNLELQNGANSSSEAHKNFFISQRGLDLRHKLCTASKAALIENCSNKRSTRNEVQFQKSYQVGLLQLSNTPASAWSCSTIYPEHLNSNSVKMFHINEDKVSLENDSYVHRNNGRYSSLSNPHLGNNLLKDISLSNQGNCYTSDSSLSNQDMFYNKNLNIPEVGFYNQQVCDLNYYQDEAGAWDGDTTTSGSYTVDLQELNDESDTFFYGSNKDVVV